MSAYPIYITQKDDQLLVWHPTPAWWETIHTPDALLVALAQSKDILIGLPFPDADVLTLRMLHDMLHDEKGCK